MKKTITNILTITGAALVTLAFICIIIGEEYLFIYHILEILGANILIYFGMIFTHKFECKYIIFEYLLDIGYTIIVLFVFGIIFNWFADRLWILVIMAVMVYILTLLIGMTRTREEADEINKLLQKRKDRNNSTAS